MMKDGREKPTGTKKVCPIQNSSPCNENVKIPLQLTQLGPHDKSMEDIIKFWNKVCDFLVAL